MKHNDEISRNTTTVLSETKETRKGKGVSFVMLLCCYVVMFIL
jgi:hypothetical protein